MDGSGGGGGFGFAALQNLHMRERETNKVRWERNNKKLIKK